MCHTDGLSLIKLARQRSRGPGIGDQCKNRTGHRPEAVCPCFSSHASTVVSAGLTASARERLVESGIKASDAGRKSPWHWVAGLEQLLCGNQKQHQQTSVRRALIRRRFVGWFHPSNPCVRHSFEEDSSSTSPAGSDCSGAQEISIGISTESEPPRL